MGFWDKLLGVRPNPPEAARKLGRNARCWCGSGRKYKQCCRDADQRYFSRELEAACKSGG
jgi:hypothetical protein